MQNLRTEGERRVTLPGEVPLFPLPDHVLLPGVLTPYRVFEPRYRTLVEELLAAPDQERWISVPRLAAGWKRDYHGTPAFCELATVGRVTSCEELSGGHYLISVEGEARCRLHERPSDRPYRVARIEAVPDLPCELPGRELTARWESIVEAVYALTQLLGSAVSDLAAAAAVSDRDALMSFRLAGAAVDTADERQQILEDRRLEHRLERVLDALSGLVALASRHVGARADA
ncbi:MAG: LON peptidase substrate-binding domain-containing protein [Deltaproteobacteria bacterium]|nr:LON peptidase substrate-binding domain-containing protein [Deltaproteobacteria bacterium]